jgi:hypothetical protein
MEMDLWILRWESGLTSYLARSVTATSEALFIELADTFDVSSFLTLLSFLDSERVQPKILVYGAARLSQLAELPTASSSHLMRDVLTTTRTW